MVKEYFLHTVAVAFIALAAMLQMWPLGACAVVVALAIAAKDVHAVHMTVQKEQAVAQSVQAVTDENKKLKEAIDKMQSQLGVMAFQVNQVRDYVGAPNNG